MTKNLHIIAFLPVFLLYFLKYKGSGYCIFNLSIYNSNVDKKGDLS